jgi:hypothetical protein
LDCVADREAEVDGPGVNLSIDRAVIVEDVVIQRTVAKSGSERAPAASPACATLWDVPGAS